MCRAWASSCLIALVTLWCNEDDFGFMGDDDESQFGQVTVWQQVTELSESQAQTSQFYV